MEIKKGYTGTRGEKIPELYFQLLDQHIRDVVNGNAAEFMELGQIAGKLFVSSPYLTELIKKATGFHPCYHYDRKIIEQAQRMLSDPGSTVASVAYTLTYDPSNFTKFFKKMTGMTPMQWRNHHQASQKP